MPPPPAPHRPPSGAQEGARHLPHRPPWHCTAGRAHRALTFPVIHSLWSTMGPECCGASHTRLQRNYSWNETQAHFSLIRYNPIPQLKTGQTESFFVSSLNNCADIAHEYWDNLRTIVLLTECDCSCFSSVPPILHQLLKERRRLRQKVFAPIQLAFRI